MRHGQAARARHSGNCRGRRGELEGLVQTIRIKLKPFLKIRGNLKHEKDLISDDTYDGTMT